MWKIEQKHTFFFKHQILQKIEHGKFLEILFIKGPNHITKRAKFFKKFTGKFLRNRHKKILYFAAKVLLTREISQCHAAQNL